MLDLKFREFFFLILFGCTIYLIWQMFAPFLHALVLAAIFTGISYSTYDWVLSKTGLNRSLVAIMMCLFHVVVIFIPLAFILVNVAQESVGMYEGIKDRIDDQSLMQLVATRPWLQKILDYLQVDLTNFSLKAQVANYLQEFSGVFFQTINKQVSNLFSFLFSFLVMLLTMYSLYTEGPTLKRFIFSLSPLPTSEHELILKKFNQINFVTLVGNGVGGLIQGIFTGFIFYFMGLPSVLFLTFCMIVLSFIPLVGGTLLYIPVAIYLALSGSWGKAVVLLLLCLAIGFVIENWFKPRFIGNKIQTNSLFILFALIGGMKFFGMIGIFYGPLLAIIFLTTVEIYHDYYMKSFSQ